MIDALRSHVPRQHTTVGSETGHGDPDVIVNLEQLLLVSRELGGSLVHRGQHHMRPGSQPYGRTALLDSLHGVFHLMQAPRGAPCGHIRVVLVPKHPSCLFPDATAV